MKASNSVEKPGSRRAAGEVSFDLTGNNQKRVTSTTGGTTSSSILKSTTSAAPEATTDEMNVELDSAEEEEMAQYAAEWDKKAPGLIAALISPPPSKALPNDLFGTVASGGGRGGGEVGRRGIAAITGDTLGAAVGRSKGIRSSGDSGGDGGNTAAAILAREAAVEYSIAAGKIAATNARRESMAQFNSQRAIVVSGKIAAASDLDPEDIASYGLLAKLRDGHNLGVYYAAWADDGSHIASCSHDGSVVLWDIRKCAVRRTYVGHEGPVYSVNFSPLGANDRIATAGEDRTIRLWAKRSGTQLFVFRDLRVPALTAAFCHDGSLLAGAGANGHIIIWNMEMLEFGGLAQADGTDETATDAASRLPPSSALVVLNIEGFPDSGDGHTGAVRRVAWSQRDDCLASGGDDLSVKIWALASGGSLHHSLEGHSGAIHDLAFAPEKKSQRIASASADSTVRIWNYHKGGEAKTVLKGVHNGAVYSLVWVPTQNARRLLSGGHDRSVVVWDTFDGTPLHLLPGIHASWIFGLVMSPDGSCFATASGDRTLGLWGALPRTFSDRFNNGVSGFMKSLLADCVRFGSELGSIGSSSSGNQTAQAVAGRSVATSTAIVESGGLRGERGDAGSVSAAMALLRPGSGQSKSQASIHPRIMLDANTPTTLNRGSGSGSGNGTPSSKRQTPTNLNRRMATPERLQYEH